MAGYHAHIYFDAGQERLAHALRQQIVDRFRLPVGQVHPRPVGPHPKGMFQVLFSETQFGSFVPWLMAARGGLDVLVHRDTGDDLSDHTQYVLWLGNSLPLRLDVLQTIPAAP